MLSTNDLIKIVKEGKVPKKRGFVNPNESFKSLEEDTVLDESTEFYEQTVIPSNSAEYFKLKAEEMDPEFAGIYRKLASTIQQVLRGEDIEIEATPQGYDWENKLLRHLPLQRVNCAVTSPAQETFHNVLGNYMLAVAALKFAHASDPRRQTQAVSPYACDRL